MKKTRKPVRRPRVTLATLELQLREILTWLHQHPPVPINPYPRK